jgi:hypothetical protein
MAPRLSKRALGVAEALRAWIESVLGSSTHGAGPPSRRPRPGLHKMQVRTTHYLPPPVLASVFAASAMMPRYAAADARPMHCTPRLRTATGAARYRQIIETGTVTCSHITATRVTIRPQFVGLTAGKSSITNGVGAFTDVRSLDGTPGLYTRVAADAGMRKAGAVQVLANAVVSLALPDSSRRIDRDASAGGGVTISRSRLGRSGRREACTAQLSGG